MFPWLTVTNKDKIGEIFVYGEITEEKWYDEDVTPSTVKDVIHSLKKTESINMYVNSPGGGVFAGMAIYNMLSRIPQHITAYVDGLSASIASVITLVADTIYIPDTAMMMVHNPAGFAMGEADEMRKTADLLDKVKETILSVYNKQTKLSNKKLAKMMDDETWMIGQEAVDLGFADALDSRQTDAKMSSNSNSVIINGLNVDINKFKSFPAERIAIRNRQKDDILERRKRFNVLKNLNGGM